MAVGRRAQRVLHLHRLQHHERRTAGDVDARLGEKRSRYPASARRCGCCRRPQLAGEQIDPLQIERSARGDKIELASRPRRRHPLRRIAQTEVDHAAAARNELQTGIAAVEFQAQSVVPVPQAASQRSLPRRKPRRRRILPAMVQPSVRCHGDGGRRRTCSFCSRASTAAHAAARSSGPSGGARGEHRKLALDQAGIDVAAANCGWRTSASGRRDWWSADDLESGERLGHAAERVGPVAGMHDQLGEQRIVMRVTASPARTPVSTRSRRLAARARCRMRADRRQEAFAGSSA